MDVMTKKDAIKLIRTKYNCTCSCGATIEHWWEGESICPVYDKEMEKLEDWAIEHKSLIALHVFDSNGDLLTIKNFLMKSFDIKKEDLK